ncbi:PEP/pyruvate-binding domain-containing protein [Pseudohongiella spirulinae]|uniref:Phosphoenolpyruvate synthase n=1 Tax=Pseudohongiella spirulinae TaxID=1249552 RepID=A0A0S2KED4_9GAMM|nr:PEP/pyruvate-binding domain-containing protein [Pseudohongiella spirulinae]ALO46673.1 Phosphoenolpyruvate synthase [Pseudohongiella spirulinae]
MRETEQSNEVRVSSGLDALDSVLDGLRIGDNVVWRVSDIRHYRRFIPAFIRTSAAAGRQIIYLRFGQHDALVQPQTGVKIVCIDAQDGFEAFTGQVWRQIEQHGRGAFYVFDSLSELLDAWATDVMVGNFFRVVCPYLYELDTVAWFAMHPQRHASVTQDRIRNTTQVMIDVFSLNDELYIQPVKVWRRHSPTMFLPHQLLGQQFKAVTDSNTAAQLQSALEAAVIGERPVLDYWERLFEQLREQGDVVSERALRVLFSREQRIQSLVGRYFTVNDLLSIRHRMLGSGVIGGKATGLLLAGAILRRSARASWQERLLAHDSCFIGSDAFYGYLVHNGLWSTLMRHRFSESDYFSAARDLHAAILKGRFPPEFSAALDRVLEHFGQYPILVRSSSLLEDGFGNAFAGKYESVFLSNQGDPEERRLALEGAVRQVYASVVSEDALLYRQQRGLQQREEPMALLLQRVNGRFHGRYYLPDAAGVAVSRNTFAWDPDMNPAAGMMRLVAGLGTRAVDRIAEDHAAVIALDLPLKRPFRSEHDAFACTQQQLDVLDMNSGRLSSLPVGKVTVDLPELPLARFGEIDRQASEAARDLGLPTPVWRLSFKPLLARTDMVQCLRGILQTLEAAYQHPVDIEFTLHLQADGTPQFNLVQCRPLATLGSQQTVAIPDSISDQQCLFESRGHFMGGNIDLEIDMIIRVDAGRYSALGSEARYSTAREIGELVRANADSHRILLIGPGRWGSSSPELGVPVRFADIAGVAMLAEVAEMSETVVPDLSYGSHFFQDLVEASIAYVALFPDSSACRYFPQHLPEAAKTSAHGALQVYKLGQQVLSVQADIVEQRMLAYLRVN